MDFVEEIFHISPDQGSGSVEVLVILVVLGILTVLFIWRAKTAKRKRP